MIDQNDGFNEGVNVKINKLPSCMSSQCSLLTNNEPYPSEATTTKTN